MNPQANIMKRNDLLDEVIAEVERFLVENRQQEFSSNEIFQGLPTFLQTQLQTIAGAYTTGGCSSAASYAGVAASMLSKNGANITHNYHGYCPVLQRTEDTFLHI